MDVTSHWRGVAHRLDPVGRISRVVIGVDVRRCGCATAQQKGQCDHDVERIHGKYPNRRCNGTTAFSRQRTVSAPRRAALVQIFGGLFKKVIWPTVLLSSIKYRIELATRRVSP
ncbi:hypothetical protein D3C71_1323280 [compost metagenome]